MRMLCQSVAFACFIRFRYGVRTFAETTIAFRDHHHVSRPKLEAAGQGTDGGKQRVCMHTHACTSSPSPSRSWQPAASLTEPSPISWQSWRARYAFGSSLASDPYRYDQCYRRCWSRHVCAVCM